MFVQGGRLRGKFLLTLTEYDRIHMRANLYFLALFSNLFSPILIEHIPVISVIHSEFVH